eukprot:1185856-Prorocentrum_minimum.AAC.1
MGHYTQRARTTGSVCGRIRNPTVNAVRGFGSDGSARATWREEGIPVTSYHSYPRHLALPIKHSMARAISPSIYHNMTVSNRPGNRIGVRRFVLGSARSSR